MRIIFLSIYGKIIINQLQLIHFSKKKLLITNYILYKKQQNIFRINYAINFIKKINSYKINNYKYFASEPQKIK